MVFSYLSPGKQGLLAELYYRPPTSAQRSRVTEPRVVAYPLGVLHAKGAKTTTWIWNLHSDAHDFCLTGSAMAGKQKQGGKQMSNATARENVRATISQGLVTRKVFSSGLAHLSLVFFWLGGMHFHGAYFANTSAWNKDPKHCLPSAQTVSSLVGQDILNSDVGGYFQGINITSGFFQLWRSEGIVTEIHLKYASCASLIGTIVSLGASYFHMHTSACSFIASRSTDNSGLGYASVHHLFLLLGLGSMSWSAHQIHISLPINRLLDSGVDPAGIPWPQDLLFKECQEGFSDNSASGFPSAYYSNTLLESLPIAMAASHHFYLALVLISSGLGRYSNASQGLELSRKYNTIGSSGYKGKALHAQLSINLLFAGVSSLVFAHHVYAIPVYPYLGSDYPTVLSLFCHHINIAAALTAGAGAHASISMIRDLNSNTCLSEANHYYLSGCIVQNSSPQAREILNHRCIIIGHLIYLSIALGFHSFGLYIHNDTLQGLGRAEDMFADNSIGLKPVFVLLPLGFDIEMLDGKVARLTQELSTADFMVHHIHAFTIHVTLLVLLKGILYARSSRLVSDKLELGWRYPCDGPGRGGTCQISPYDHLYLAVFWAYNSLSVVLFHYFWKMQSDVWANQVSITQTNNNIQTLKIEHISGGDFSVNSATVNGWLRNFLWSQAAQVIQSYGTSISAYGLVFLFAHFVWAFSLMFLYSGRGYWQELIESILWAHHKLKIVNVIQPAALSISHGRAVALVHYILGGLGCTFAL
jgi:photosystem I P700 chlorophyll a apoprotein A1